MNKKLTFGLVTVLFFVSGYLLYTVSWKVWVGVVLFGWMMNIERKYLNK